MSKTNKMEIKGISVKSPADFIKKSFRTVITNGLKSCRTLLFKTILCAFVVFSPQLIAYIIKPDVTSHDKRKIATNYKFS